VRNPTIMATCIRNQYTTLLGRATMRRTDKDGLIVAPCIAFDFKPHVSVLRKAVMTHV